MLRTFSRSIFIVGLFAVITLSVMPAADMPHIEAWDKLEHIAAYAALALAGDIAFRGTRSLLMLAVGLFLLGAGLEAIQTFVPGRTASGYDMLANAIGIALGAASAAVINEVIRTRLKSPG